MGKIKKVILNYELYVILKDIVSVSTLTGEILFKNGSKIKTTPELAKRLIHKL